MEDDGERRRGVEKHDVGLIEIWGGWLTYEIFALVDMAVLASPDLLPELEVPVLDQELLVGGQPIVFHLHS
jgi:hypothetical protein